MKHKNRLKKFTQPKRGTDPDPVIKFKLDAERDKEIQRKRDLERARVIYETWKHSFINRPKHADQLAEAANDLAVKLEAGIEDKSILEYVFTHLLGPKIAVLHESAIVRRYTVDVLWDCPCGAGGMAGIGRTAYDDGLFHLVCPECKKELTKADTALKADIDRQGEEWKEPS